ncbi:MAG: FAD/NAD(P)-binding protein [Rhodospirillales bacterium]
MPDDHAAFNGAAAPLLIPDLYRVDRRVMALGDTVTLDIAPLQGGPAPAFGHGQFNMIGALGAGEVPISIAGSPPKGDGFRHTIRLVGGGTRALGGLRKGDCVTFRGPFGKPWPLDGQEGRDIIVVTGGLGLAPLRSLILAVLERRLDFGRFMLFHGARAPRELLYLDELQAWRGRFDADVRVTVDRAGPDWLGPVGVVTKLIQRAQLDPGHTSAFVCGPEIMMRFAASALTDKGVDAGNIFVSLERNMKCAVGFCGHCQLGPRFVCKDGPVFTWTDAQPLLKAREL